MEKMLVVLKPDALQRRLVGEILGRLERKGVKIAAMKMLQVDLPRAKKMYSVHKEKDFYEPLLKFITASPVIAMVAEGVDVIHIVRAMMGKTFGPDADSGTIRGDFGMSRRYNLIHGSDCPDSAAREIPIFFDEDEIIDYKLAEDTWVYSVIDR
ncbi:MAG: nucleoside-diphosphate kinase [Phycisphaerae bacterium]|nr:nucleoside-diphosphate kinase [Phycisphaerae bacterium]